MIIVRLIDLIPQKDIQDFDLQKTDRFLKEIIPGALLTNSNPENLKDVLSEECDTKEKKGK